MSNSVSLRCLTEKHVSVTGGGVWESNSAKFKPEECRRINWRCSWRRLAILMGSTVAGLLQTWCWKGRGSMGQQLETLSEGAPPSDLHPSDNPCLSQTLATYAPQDAPWEVAAVGCEGAARDWGWVSPFRASLPPEAAPLARESCSAPSSLMASSMLLPQESRTSATTYSHLI